MGVRTVQLMTVVRFSGTAALLAIAAHLSGCTSFDRVPTRDHFAKTPPPNTQVFRWSNGRAPKTIDPARVSSAPETDIVRAIYEGLTELDAATLSEVPAAAETWTSSTDHRTWRFTLRSDAKWTNGRPVTAGDFERSWKRAFRMGKEAPHRSLLANIIGFGTDARSQSSDLASTALKGRDAGRTAVPANRESPGIRPSIENANTGVDVERSNDPTVQKKDGAGIVAADERTLVVSLIAPDRELPKLLAHPVFRPVFDDGTGLSGNEISVDTVTNGPFRMVEGAARGLMLERSVNYWNRDAIRLERIEFVHKASSEEALDAYRAGEVDAVTNTEFSPVLLKLLSPYQDFRKQKFAAINLYEFNISRSVYRDRRVREALTLAIEREKLTEGELEGATQPAHTFLPFGSAPKRRIVQDKDKARELLELAGFANGVGFPVVKLTVNRNETQLRIARSVAGMWKTNLNIETEIVIREPAEVEELRSQGEFDLVRRGVVMTTPNEAVNLRAIFGANYTPERSEQATDPNANAAAANTRPSNVKPETNTGNSAPGTVQMLPSPVGRIASEDDALFELTAIPLYFPSSYALVKPFVVGFESNSLDATLLHEVYIDTDWNETSETGP